jgi:hypothetical protein
MKRILKFRAFDKVMETFIEDYGQTIYVETYGWNDDCYIVNQFTGLLDKNGVEIYEGDILDNNKQVYWSIEQACYFCGDVPLCMSNSHREIIGNIYENKDLLK